MKVCGRSLEIYGWPEDYYFGRTPLAAPTN